MSIHILHHGQCFDGAASAALFWAFYRQKMTCSQRVHFIAKDHRPGDPYEEQDFACDVAAIVDFRYSQYHNLQWFFDHHRSAFQQPGDREHFNANQNGQKFHDDGALSCAGYIAQIARDRFACDLSCHQELIEWANRIDSANFPDPQMPVALKEAPLQLMTFVECNHQQELIAPFIHDLLEKPMKVHAQADYVRQVLRPYLEQHYADIDLIRRKSQVTNGVLHLNLLDQPSRTFNKFIPYYHHPNIRYVVSMNRAQSQHIKLTVGFNPWLPEQERKHNLADLLEPFGGGGHPYVAGSTFPKDREEDAIQVHQRIVDILSEQISPKTPISSALSYTAGV